MTKNCPTISGLHLCKDELLRENHDFRGTGGVSKENRSYGFIPAFIDIDTGAIYMSRNKDGSCASIHKLEGLPEELVVERDHENRIIAVKQSVVPGFVKDNVFYTREQAAMQVCN